MKVIALGLALCVCSCTIARVQTGDVGLWLAAPANTRVEVAPRPTPNVCEAAPSGPVVTIDSSIADTWSSTLAAIAVAFFSAVKVVGW